MPLSCEPSNVASNLTRPECHNLLILSLASFCLIGFGVWVFSAGKRYREDYANTVEGWRIGSSRSVELTLVADDMRTLACTSDHAVAGLRCGEDGEVPEGGPDPQILQPYNTTGSEILLGAGLWACPDMKPPLPPGRFTVVCNYNIKGVIKSAAVRFGRTGSFGPLGRTTTVGTLTECMIPR